MLIIVIALFLMLRSTALAQPSVDFQLGGRPLMLVFSVPEHFIEFNADEEPGLEIGRLTDRNGQTHFKGDAIRAAEMLIKELRKENDCFTVRRYGKLIIHRGRVYLEGDTTEAATQFLEEVRKRWRSLCYVV